MKKVTILAFLVLVLFSFSARAQMQTLVVTPSNILSSVITVASNSYVVFKSADYDYGGLLLLNIQGVSFSIDISDESIDHLTIAGPATFQLQAHCCAYYSTFVTFEIKPGPFPPAQAFTVGSNSGNVQVTMQTSTDLVNWNAATNGLVYTNNPAARFFRMQLLTNVQSP